MTGIGGGATDQPPGPPRFRSQAAAALIGVWGQVAGALIDLIMSVGGYYLLRALGVSQFLALLFGLLPTIGLLVYQAIRRRRIDALSVFVLLLLTAAAAASFVTGSPRFLLAKAGWFTAGIGAMFLVTLALARPLTFTLARVMLQRTRLAAPLQTASWDEFWHRQPRFRRAWRVSTLLWGAVLVVEAVVRVVMAYTLPIDAVPAVGAVLATATFIGLQVIQQLYFLRTGLWQLVSVQPETPTR